jgi:hypothetical protein
MPAKEGYTTCPQTPLGQPCTVACAQDFSGASTVYKCELVNGQPTFVPQGTEQVCNKIQYARKHASALCLFTFIRLSWLHAFSEVAKRCNTRVFRASMCFSAGLAR